MSNYVLMHGDCLEQLKSLPDCSVDSLVTDPPAGIAFMGKEWDEDKGGRKQWVAWMTDVMTEALRVLKPGAHGLVWALPRTSHWTATALEDAGFEVRDVITHLFGTGFPKSMDISKAIDKAAGAERVNTGVLMPGHSETRNRTFGKNGEIYGDVKEAKAYVTLPATDAAKEWSGWGTALKPASEHWILVRKPCSEKTVAANVLKWGVGGINVDGCRVEGEKGVPASLSKAGNLGFGTGGDMEKKSIQNGRFPANLVLDEEAAAALDAQSGWSPSNKRKSKAPTAQTLEGQTIFKGHGAPGNADDSGGASRFFYVAKASKTDKGEGNTHPTVKSTALMRYLCKMVTPPGGVVLDPFTGSGSTGVAAITEGFFFIGVEKENEYASIAEARLNAVQDITSDGQETQADGQAADKVSSA